MKTLIKYNLLLVSIIFCFTPTQEIKSQDFGADVVSSYVWRGTKYGTGPAVQPWMELGAGNLTGGVWGSFNKAEGAYDGNELDLWVSYDFGPLALTVTNYTFPGAGGAGDVFDGDNGDIEVSGSTSLGPVDLTVGYFTDHGALYVEAGFPIGPVGVAVGYASDGDIGFYAGGDSGIVNVSFSGEKDIKITEDYSLPVFGSFIINHVAEGPINFKAAFLVFGFSL